MAFERSTCPRCGREYWKRGERMNYCIACRKEDGVCTSCGTPGSEFYVSTSGRCRSCTNEGQRSRRKPCVDCGVKCWGDRCKPCADRELEIYADVVCKYHGCGARAQVKGVCRDHYTRRGKAKNCAWCGVEFVPMARAKGDVCSRACAWHWRRSGGMKSASRELVFVPSASRRVDAARRLAVAAVGSRGDRVWVAGSCGVCGGAFVGLRHALYPVCGSDACVEEKDRRVEHDKRARRRARLAGARVGRVDRERVFVRDGYRCHLCGFKTNPSASVPDLRAPTLDHIVPLSLGGEHSMVNVACACFGCNSRKSNVGFGDQLALFG